MNIAPTIYSYRSRSKSKNVLQYYDCSIIYFTGLTIDISLCARNNPLGCNFPR